MAKKFSNCEVIGIDVAPVPVEPENLPPNCHFEMDDIQLGLGHFHLPSNQFDLIHARFISGGLQDFRKALKDVMQCLKPGGLIIWIDADYQGFSSETYVPLSLGSDIHPNGSWMGRIGYGKLRR
jgi:SAM-dependent methyltransferase